MPPKILHDIFEAISNKGGRAFVVGGAVRDMLFNKIHGINIVNKDFDVEVFDIDMSKIIEIVSHFGKVDIVGKQFGVIKLFSEHDGDFDFSLPRRDNKVGVGHKNFDVVSDPHMSMNDAAARRDFTMNSAFWDINNNTVIDPFNGTQDIVNRILRPTSFHFAEDALRVLRGMQFAARFDMHVVDDNRDRQMMREMKREFKFLSKERIWEEWRKWAEKSIKPSAGIQFLLDVGWISAFDNELFPAICDIVACEQDATWHPEGNVLAHTMHVCDAMHMICVRDNVTGEDRVARMFAALAHDFGKPDTFVVGDDNRIHNPAHDIVGVPITVNFMREIGRFCGEGQEKDALVDRIACMVKNHMRHIGLNVTPASVRRIANEIDIRDMSAIVEADHSGRPPLPMGKPQQMIDIELMAEQVAVLDARPKPIMMGRHLIEMGHKPSKQFSVILNAAFEAQLDGAFSDVEGGKMWIGANA